MAVKVIPCDCVNDYDFRASYQDHGVIDWHRPPNLEQDDIVFIYFIKPLQVICVKCVVTMKLVPKDQVIKDDKYWKKPVPPHFYEENEFSRLKVLNIVDDDKGIKIEDLEASNLGFSRYSFQGTGKTLDQTQTDFLNKHFNSMPSEARVFKEGTVVERVTKTYDRDDRAKQICLDHYGIKCQVCGKDFIKEYGEIGKGCIHVHHLIPLSKKHDNRETDPIKDLIPVCPNCHALIHKAMDKDIDVSTLDKIKKALGK